MNLQEKLNILHKLKHNNIIELKKQRKTKNHHYIVLDYCNGGDLESYIKDYINKNKYSLNEFYIQKIIHQFLRALNFMQKNKMIHGGIKSNNILLNFDSYPDIPNNGNLPPKLTFNQKSLNKLFTVKIADLRYTKDLLKNSEDSITSDDKEHKKYNNSLGLWSLGVITYEMLTGSAPFSENSFKEDFKNIKKGIKYFPKTLKPSIEIISFLNGLLNYYPEKRLNWEQINSHPFLTKNPNEFTFIDLETITENEQEKIEINSHNNDNHLWVFSNVKMII